MYLLSTGRTTVLSDFVDLETKTIYQHTNGETTDFQFCQKQRVFVEVNKKSGLEILRIKEKQDQKLEIQRERKLKIDNVFCVACASQSLENNMALGLCNGQVLLYKNPFLAPKKIQLGANKLKAENNEQTENYKNTELVHRFKAESSRNSVLHLDYNASDEYLASVLESGQINIYGIKTKTKIDHINIDGNSTLARFHPVRRFQLSIASYKGSVTLYDVQAKRKLFHSVDAHLAPCRDLTLCAAAPDTLISVGFDCFINIFDTRRKTQPLQLKYCYPLSTVAMSDCGTFFCVGNLKGELISYDMRNTKIYLASKKVHDCPVTRVAFVPSEGDAVAATNASSFCSNNDNQTIDGGGSGNNSFENLPSAAAPAGAGGDLRKSIASNILQGALPTATSSRGRDSFCDFLDFHANKCVDKTSSRFTMRRDSFDWDTLARKVGNDSIRASLVQMSSTNSSANNSVNAIADNTHGSFNDQAIKSDFVNTKARHKTPDDMKISDEQERSPMTPLRDRNTIAKVTTQFSGNLVQIAEEQTQSSIQNNSSSSDKENPQNELVLGSRLHILPADRNSTPNRTRHSLESYIPPSYAKSQQQTPINVGLNFDMRQEIADLRVEMNKRFEQLEGELKFNAETNKWQMFTQASNLWNRQIDSTEEIRDALGILLQTDPFVNEYLHLKQENEMLKEQLQQLLKKK